MSAETIPDEIKRVACDIVTDVCVKRGQMIGFRELENEYLERVIAKAIHDAVMAERERCAGIADAEYEKRFANQDDYPASRVHDFLVVAVAIGKGIKADFHCAPKSGA